MNAQTVAYVSSQALLHNYRLCRKAGLELIPMIKANAYGHDVALVMKVLQNEKGRFAWGVATLEEGVQVRRELKNLDPRQERILVFSGAHPWQASYTSLCKKHHLTPVLNCREALENFLNTSSQLPYHLSFNSGMNRLGLTEAELANVIPLIQKKNHPPEGVLTHFAGADISQHPRHLRQIRKTLEMVRWLKVEFPNALLHAENSAALLHSLSSSVSREQRELHALMDLARPGIALYGYAHTDFKAPLLKPVLDWRIQVARVFWVSKGDTVGYGFTYRSSGKGTWVAILQAGYGDGVPRIWSNRGFAYSLNGRQAWKFAGRVSMDMSAIDLGPKKPKLRAGDWVRVLGPGVDSALQAELAQTNIYELVTRVGPRVHRVLS